MSVPTLRQRLFALMLRKGDSINRRIYHSLKKDLFRDIQGLVVEIGPGAGVNFDYLPAGTTWVGVEPNEALHSTLLLRAQQEGIQATLIAPVGDGIPQATNTADVFICTLVLCSVPNPAGTIAEMLRILKPGGKLILIEHVASSTSPILLWLQHLFNPFNRLVADGCNCNRKTWAFLEVAGFSQLIIRHSNVNGAMIFHRPHIFGYAIK